jgi:hypothetical protein
VKKKWLICMTIASLASISSINLHGADQQTNLQLNQSNDNKANEADEPSREQEIPENEKMIKTWGEFAKAGYGFDLEDVPEEYLQRNRGISHKVFTNIGPDDEYPLHSWPRTVPFLPCDEVDDSVKDGGTAYTLDRKENDETRGSAPDCWFRQWSVWIKVIMENHGTKHD